MVVQEGGECTTRKFFDKNKLGGAVDSEEQDALQRNLVMLDHQAIVNVLIFNRNKC